MFYSSLVDIQVHHLSAVEERARVGAECRSMKATSMPRAVQDHNPERPRSLDGETALRLFGHRTDEVRAQQTVQAFYGTVDTRYHHEGLFGTSRGPCHVHVMA